MTSEEIPACFQHLIHQPVAQPTTHPTAARSWFWAQPGDREALSQRLCSAPGCRSARWSATPQHPRLSAAGAQLAVGELTDGGALAAAMQPAGAVFAVTTPFEAGLDAELLQGHAIIGAATAARVPQLVFSSVAEALAGTGIPAIREQSRDRSSAGRRRRPAHRCGTYLFLRQRSRRLPGSAERRTGTAASRRPRPAAT